MGMQMQSPAFPQDPMFSLPPAIHTLHTYREWASSFPTSLSSTELFLGPYFKASLHSWTPPALWSFLGTVWPWTPPYLSLSRLLASSSQQDFGSTGFLSIDSPNTQGEFCYCLLHASQGLEPEFSWLSLSWTSSTAETCGSVPTQTLSKSPQGPLLFHCEASLHLFILEQQPAEICPPPCI